MRSKNKQILVVGDRVLIKPDKGEKKSKAGLYLPPSVVEKKEILSGVIVEVGPGIPLGEIQMKILMNPGQTMTILPLNTFLLKLILEILPFF